MGRIIPFGAIPTSSVVPDGIYHLKIVELKETASKADEENDKKAKLMYKLTAEILAPEGYKGTRLFENFVIGTDDDPEAEDLATWTSSIGGKAFKRLAGKLTLPTGDEEDSDSFCEAAKEQEFMATVITEVDDGKKNPKYKGNVRNKTTAYWSVGEKEAKTTGAAPANQPAGKAAATKAGKPAAAKPAAAAAAKKQLACNFPGCSEKVDSPAAMTTHVNEHMAALQGGKSDQATGTDDDE